MATEEAVHISTAEAESRNLEKILELRKRDNDLQRQIDQLRVQCAELAEKLAEQDCLDKRLNVLWRTFQDFQYETRGALSGILRRLGNRSL